jgi:hypothetical protein
MASAAQPKKAVWIGILILVLVGVGIALYSRQNSQMDAGSVATPDEAPSPIPSPSSQATSAMTSQKQPSENVGVHSNSNAETETQHLDVPNLKEVREQIAKDPHQTPPALLKFARDLAEKTEVAKRSPEKAKTLFETLENCLQGGKDPSESTPVAAQTLCITTAEELTKLYPQEFSSRLKQLEENASPELKKIRNAFDQF